MRKIINEGNGYRTRATRKVIGTFDVVAIDWEHPNYGYFADAMLWIWSPHLDKWIPVHIANWTKEYETSDSFLKNYPAFKEFFESPDSLREIRKEIRRELPSVLQPK
jgi:hypothetical protein